MHQRVIVYLLALISLLPFCSVAQHSADSTVNSMVSNAVSLMEKGDYLKADAAFRKMLVSKKKLPDNVAFYYGKTLYELKNYGKAQNYLKKYVDLTGKEGKYYDEASRLLNKLSPSYCNKCEGTGYKMAQITCENCHGKGQLNVECPFCAGKGVNKCRTCGGDGVLKQTGKMGQMTFNNCPTCNGSGHMTCEACKGTRRYDKQCEICKGKGTVEKKVICNHQ